jgi:hypothetical protein
LIKEGLNEILGPESNSTQVKNEKNNMVIVIGAVPTGEYFSSVAPPKRIGYKIQSVL